MIFFRLLSLILFSTAIYAGQVIQYESDEPGTDLSLRKSLSGPFTASVYESNASSDPELYEASDVFLRVDGFDGVWWIHTPQPYDSMDIIDFVGTSNLLVSLSTPVASSTAVFDVNDRSLELIGSGTGEVITDSSGETMIRLSGQRGYSDGVVWYRSVTDLQGRVIEFLSTGTSCLSISEIVSAEADLSRLRQPMDFCVGIEK